MNEPIEEDLSKCLIQEEGTSGPIYKAKNTQGEVLLAMTEKKSQRVFFQLNSALQSMSTLLPNRYRVSLKRIHGFASMKS